MDDNPEIITKYHSLKRHDFILPDLNNQYKDRDFMIVGVGIDDQQKIADFVKKLEVTYSILVGGQSAMNEFYQYGNLNGALPL